MKKWIALLLAVLLTTSLFPTVTAAKAEADSSDIWAEIARIEDSAINARTVQTEAAAAAYAANVDKIIAAVEASDAYVPGSINRHGDFFYFTTTDGQVNGYSPRLRAKIRGAKATGADPEAVSGVETTSFGTRGGWPSSKNVAVFQPYYGLDSSFTTQYPEEGVSIAQATGGTSTTYKTNDATVDAIADAIESCGVVIFDSHGDTDYANGYDYTSRANTSYICLQSGTGLTSADQAAVTGPYGTYYHAYFAGSGYGGMQYYCVDGTAISNHMEGNSPNGLLWMAICLGMATDGLEAPMRDRGVEVVYGYSQSVTFAGDFDWEEVFWDEMIAGKNVADSISTMKTQIGCPDPYTYSYPAWPIVVSDEDAYPGHGNVDAAQTVYSTWTLQQGFEVSAYSSDETRGTVSVMGTTVTAVPRIGCYTSGYEVTEGVATVEQNGDVLEVTPESDCTIRVDFADRNPAALTYHVPEGVTCPAAVQGYENDSVTVSAPKGTPTADGEDYYFCGWTTAEFEDVDVLPRPVYKPGDEMLLSAGQTDLYALYRYFKPDDPTVPGEFLRMDAEPESWEGEIVITYQSQKALDASGKYTGSTIGSKYAVVDLENAGVVVSDNYLINVPDEMIYVVTKSEDGSYRIRMKNSEYMLCITSNTNSLNTTKSPTAKTARWSMKYANGTPLIQSVNYEGRSLQYNTSLKQFRAFKDGDKEALTVYQANPGKMMYATILHDKVVCDEHDFTDWTVTAEATCVAAGERSHYCRVCGFAETEVLPIDPNHHTGNTEQHGEVKPTCTEDGKKADTYCADCGAKLADGETIPALGHAWSEPVFTWSGYESAKATRTCERDASHTETKAAAVTSEVTQEPTPTTDGIKTYTASVVFDGVTYTDTKTETIPATGYTWGEPTWEWAEDGSAATATFTANEDASIQQTLDAEISSVVRTEPGCETPGLRENTAKVTFRELEYTDVRTYEIPATGHAWGEPVIAFSEDGTAATATRVCANDPVHVETRDCTVTAEVTTAPTCTEDGVTTYTAVVEFVGVTYTETTTRADVPATGHDWDFQTIEFSEDYTSATAVFVCRKDETHTMTLDCTVQVESEEAPTCTEPGVTVYVATVEFEGVTYVGTAYVDGDPALGHDWSEPMITFAEDGTTAVACRVCSRNATHVEFKTCTVTAAVTTPATCTEPGVTTYTATAEFDGVTYTDTTTRVDVPALGHTAGPVVVENEVAPTCTEDGSYDEVVYCSVCGAELERKTVTTPATGHTPAEAVKENEKAATCTEAGGYDMVVYCTVCGEELSREHTEIPATGHTPAEAVKENEKAATCTEAGGYDMVVYCSVCNAELSREHTEIPATGHGWSEPAFTWNGYESATATRICAKDLTHVETKDAVVTAEVTTAPTMTEDGVRTYTAAVEFDGVTYTDTKTETIPATGLVNPFVDVKEGDFFYDAVLWAFYHDPQITAGTSKTKFSPSNTCTREQVVTFLWRAKGCEEPKNTQNPFKDVPADAYYTNAVLWAVENGITNGKSKTRFGVGEPCTREQVVTFLWRAEGEPEHEPVDNPFTDVSETAYSYNAILWAVEKGITNGTSKTKFSPAKTCTRGEVVTFLWRNDQNN